MTASVDTDGQARRAAATIFSAYRRFRRDFQALTRRAHLRFEQRDWRGMQADAAARLELYPRAVEITLGELTCFLGEADPEPALWTRIREHYSEHIADQRNDELARTFYNSITRKLFSTVGVNPDVEFFDLRPTPLDPGAVGLLRTYAGGAPSSELLTEVLTDTRLVPVWRDLPDDARRVSEALDDHLASRGAGAIERIEMLRPVFFRNQGAYLVGRVMTANGTTVPLVLALVHPDGGVRVDAVLMTEPQVSIVFSFTRSYFHVQCERPREVVSFLTSILPRKPLDELYISLGFNKHGKTELFRNLFAHLRQGNDRFRTAPGQRGLVMIVFTLGDLDVIFKVIRDRFGAPKTSSRREVMAQYRLVFRRDRVGRLVDAQEFEHLELDRSLFEPDLLAELLSEGGRTVRARGERVILAHVYTERRLTPLDIYLREAPGEAARRAVIDYGDAIKDLAKANIFPGDFVLKNFGVTRHERVVFYDYDELRLLTDCRFRRIPPPRTPEEELDPEPWFRVGEHDIFPEEFAAFVELGGDLRRAFVDRHGDLFTVEFWRDLQERNRRGEIMEFFPYRMSDRLRRS